MTIAFSPEALTPDEFNGPFVRMTPFETADLAADAAWLRTAPPARDDWHAALAGPPVRTLTRSGRQAIALALDDLALGRDDEVLIVTTSGGPYVSACVTETVAGHCRWARAPSDRTRAILMIHEFGFPAALDDGLKALGLPLIEDCAYAAGAAVGGSGDYVIYSLPKSIPVPYGGVLASRRPPARDPGLSARARQELPVLAQRRLDQAGAAYARRREVFEAYRRRFAAEGLAPRFEPGAGAVPHSFVVKMDDQPLAERMKPLLQRAGIISSVFYGGGGYFLPNHQAMSDAVVDYVVAQFMSAMARASGSGPLAAAELAL